MLTLAHPEIVQDPAAGSSTVCESMPTSAAAPIEGQRTEEHDQTPSLCKVPAISIDEDHPILQQQHVNGQQGAKQQRPSPGTASQQRHRHRRPSKQSRSTPHCPRSHGEQHEHSAAIQVRAQAWLKNDILSSLLVSLMPVRSQYMHSPKAFTRSSVMLPARLHSAIICVWLISTLTQAGLHDTPHQAAGCAAR